MLSRADLVSFTLDTTSIKNPSEIGRRAYMENESGLGDLGVELRFQGDPLSHNQQAATSRQFKHDDLRLSALRVFQLPRVVSSEVLLSPSVLQAT